MRRILLVVVLLFSLLIPLQSVQAKPGFQLGTKGVNVLSNLILWADQGADAYGVTAAKRCQQLGIEFIRLPVEPIALMHADGTFAPEKLTALDTAIHNFTSVGLRVIVDMHSFSSFPGTQREFNREVACGGQSLDIYKRFLTPLAKHLNQFDTSRVALELLNEPYNPQLKGDPCRVAGRVSENIHWVETLNQLRQAARLGSTALTLVLSGENWSDVAALGALPRLSDPNILYSFHYYDRLAFTHQGASWIDDYFKALEKVPYPLQRRSLNSIWPKIVKNIENDDRIKDKVATKRAGRKALECYYGTPESGCQPYGRSEMLTAMTKAVQQGKRLGVKPTRLLLGEFGVLSRFNLRESNTSHTAAAIEDKVAWLQDMRQAAEAAGIAHAMWTYNDVGGFGAFQLQNPQRLDDRILGALGLDTPS
jgi:hypothetical protein